MKPTLGIVVALLYFAMIAWLVRRVGDSYRHEMMQRRVTLTRAINPPTQAAGETTPNPVSSVTAGPVASPIERPIVAEPPVAAVAPVAKKESEIERPPLARARPVLEPRPPSLRGLAPESLRGIGDELHKSIAAAHAVVDDRSALSRLERLARDLVDSETTGGNAPRFHVLDSGAVNAFSHVGDHIYVSRGIFALAQVDAELQFVVAHELAHLKLGHAAARLEQVAQGPLAEVGLEPWLCHLIPLGYSDDQEFAADAWAYQALRRADRSRREALGFLRRYGAYGEEHRLGLGRRPPQSQPGDPRQDLDNHYPSHPPVRERLARLAPEPPASGQ